MVTPASKDSVVEVVPDPRYMVGGDGTPKVFVVLTSGAADYAYCTVHGAEQTYRFEGRPGDVSTLLMRILCHECEDARPVFSVDGFAARSVHGTVRALTRILAG